MATGILGCCVSGKTEDKTQNKHRMGIGYEEYIAHKYVDHPGGSNGEHLQVKAPPVIAQPSPSSHLKDANKAISSGNLAEIREAVAVVDYQEKDTTELSFKKGERLEVVVIRGNPHWEALSRRTGKSGSVNKNYLSVLQQNTENQNYGSISRIASNASSLESLYIYGRPWYKGKISLEEANQMLSAETKTGAFLIRKVENPVCYYLSMRGEGNTCEHYDIKKNNLEKFYIYPEESFHSLQDLIKFYSNNQSQLCCPLSESCRTVLPPDGLTQQQQAKSTSDPSLDIHGVESRFSGFEARDTADSDTKYTKIDGAQCDYTVGSAVHQEAVCQLPDKGYMLPSVISDPETARVNHFSSNLENSGPVPDVDIEAFFREHSYVDVLGFQSLSDSEESDAENAEVDVARCDNTVGSKVLLGTVCPETVCVNQLSPDLENAGPVPNANIEACARDYKFSGPVPDADIEAFFRDHSYVDILGFQTLSDSEESDTENAEVDVARCDNAVGSKVLLGTVCHLPDKGYMQPSITSNPETVCVNQLSPDLKNAGPVPDANNEACARDYKFVNVLRYRRSHTEYAEIDGTRCENAVGSTALRETVCPLPDEGNKSESTDTYLKMYDNAAAAVRCDETCDVLEEHCESPILQTEAEGYDYATGATIVDKPKAADKVVDKETAKAKQSEPILYNQSSKAVKDSKLDKEELIEEKPYVKITPNYTTSTPQPQNENILKSLSPKLNLTKSSNLNTLRMTPVKRLEPPRTPVCSLRSTMGLSSASRFQKTPVTSRFSPWESGVISPIEIPASTGWERATEQKGSLESGKQELVGGRLVRTFSAGPTASPTEYRVRAILDRSRKNPSATYMSKNQQVKIPELPANSEVAAVDLKKTQTAKNEGLDDKQLTDGDSLDCTAWSDYDDAESESDGSSGAETFYLSNSDSICENELERSAVSQRSQDGELGKDDCNGDQICAIKKTVARAMPKDSLKLNKSRLANRLSQYTLEEDSDLSEHKLMKSYIEDESSNSGVQFPETGHHLDNKRKSGTPQVDKLPNDSSVLMDSGYMEPLTPGSSAGIDGSASFGKGTKGAEVKPHRFEASPSVRVRSRNSEVWAESIV